MNLLVKVQIVLRRRSVDKQSYNKINCVKRTNFYFSMILRYHKSELCMNYSRQYIGRDIISRFEWSELDLGEYSKRPGRTACPNHFQIAPFHLRSSFEDLHF